MIRLSEVTVNFGPIRAIDSVTLDLRGGECHALVGPNGAGKTTLLRVVAGLLAPTSGQVYLRGEPISADDLATLRDAVTMVFQRPVLFGTTVFKNVAYGLRARGATEEKVRHRVREALDMLGLAGLAERHARSLSGGEQRRVSIAMALVTDPEVLVLDEPTAYLDRDGVAVVEATLHELQHERGTTVIIASHDILQISRLADRVTVMSCGRVESTLHSRDLLISQLEDIALRDGVCNVFRAVTVRDVSGGAGLHLTTVRLLDNDSITLDVATDLTGEMTIRIPPEDVIVSTAPVLSSARNCLRGRVAAIDTDDSVVRLTVDVGVPLVALITRESLDRLQVSTGDNVFVTFKVSSVSVYGGAGAHRAEMHDQS